MRFSQDPALLWVMIIAGVATFLSIALCTICICCAGPPNTATGDDLSLESEYDGWYDRCSIDSAHSQSPPPYSALCGWSNPCMESLAENIGTQSTCDVQGLWAENDHDDTELIAGPARVARRLQAHCLSPPPVAMTRYRCMEGLLVASRWERQSVV